MRVTTKGQVTIPEEIRDRLGIGPGSEVEVLGYRGRRSFCCGQRKHFRRRGFRRFSRLLDHMAGTLDLGGMTTDEYTEWLRGPRENLDID
ncbi:AbrB/MazE/SpoVT family DNA-binding domain-containing protein [Mesorhizobium sp.]|uniref:AbrB/MazE/SpoVT family DNA-binding domain-containing protein n=1 Tax=Mesorhizobium sp. TaxID=1871066 RepID=UPI000FE4A70D|nr:AbrB/MazE/SpoVT family DNA-binding domain-containing protein [Mesorhizobium sp.]RWP37910.1 MAG: AbrB/MazE/SpoVT family DNA-binding domain-containing protein [Mesorhizobium sp.]